MWAYGSKSNLTLGKNSHYFSIFSLNFLSIFRHIFDFSSCHFFDPFWPKTIFWYNIHLAYPIYFQLKIFNRNFFDPFWPKIFLGQNWILIVEKVFKIPNAHFDPKTWVKNVTQNFYLGKIILKIQFPNIWSIKMISQAFWW